MRSRSLLFLTLLVTTLTLVMAACGAAVPTPTANDPGQDIAPTPAPTATATTPAPDALPSWLDNLTASFEADPMTQPPLSVTEYQYKGERVFFVPPSCCDIFSDLYDLQGTLIAHPFGGIAGIGDGREPEFATTAVFIRTV